MIEAIRQLHLWMVERHLDTQDVELTIHFPNTKSYYDFTQELARELNLPLQGIRLLGMKIHLRVDNKGDNRDG